jgi:hypothetical protein
LHFFAVEEHEDGRIRLSKETSTLMENDTVLQRVPITAKNKPWFFSGKCDQPSQKQLS